MGGSETLAGIGEDSGLWPLRSSKGKRPLLVSRVRDRGGLKSAIRATSPGGWSRLGTILVFLVATGESGSIGDDIKGDP